MTFIILRAKSYKDENIDFHSSSDGGFLAVEAPTPKSQLAALSSLKLMIIASAIPALLVSPTHGSGALAVNTALFPGPGNTSPFFTSTPRPLQSKRSCHLKF